jgi:hypothetical protein
MRYVLSMSLALTTLLALHLGNAAAAPAAACSTIRDDTERLRCYDGAGRPEPETEQDSTIAKARAVIKAVLANPESARFEGIVKRPSALCGLVNSKMPRGGYSGAKPFVYLIEENKGWVLDAWLDPLDAPRALKAAQIYCKGVQGFLTGQLNPLSFTN